MQSWFKGQNDYTRSVLAAIPGRGRLLARIEELDRSVPKIFAWRLPENLYLVAKLLPGENVLKLYKRRGLIGEDTLLLDPERITLGGSSHWHLYHVRVISACHFSGSQKSVHLVMDCGSASFIVVLEFEEMNGVTPPK